MDAVTAEPGAHRRAVGWEAERSRPDPRLPAYLVAGFGALLVAIATATPELVALGAPFIALLVAGLRDPEPKGLRGSVTFESDRAMEGDNVRGELHVDWDGEAEVDVMLADYRGVVPIDPPGVVGWALPLGRGPVTLPFTLQARSWGSHDLGALWVRVRRPGAFSVKERRLARAPVLRVSPTSLRLGRLLRPQEPRAVAGMHVARFRGHGSDFAELRPYRPGDRLRNVSWATSARLGEPWVRVNHPERTGTVLLVLDATFGDGSLGAEAMARAARAAWAVASVHLRSQDRVGLLTRGRTAAWLPPQGGRRARAMLLDELLTVGRAAEDRSRRRAHRSRVFVPADALIVGVTTLRSQIFQPELIHYRRIGHATVALVIDTSDLHPAPRSRADLAARRLWIARREAERHGLERGGVPTALVSGGDAVGPAIVALRRKMNRTRPPARVGAAAS